MTEPRHFKASSPAKLNLTFDIVGDLPDGFHQVETLMQAVDLADELTFTIKPSARYHIQLTTAEGAEVENLPTDNRNLVARAIELYLSSNIDTGEGFLERLTAGRRKWAS